MVLRANAIIDSFFCYLDNSWCSRWCKISRINCIGYIHEHINPAERIIRSKPHLSTCPFGNEVFPPRINEFDRIVVQYILVTCSDCRNIVSGKAFSISYDRSYLCYVYIMTGDNWRWANVGSWNSHAIVHISALHLGNMEAEHANSEV